MKPKALEKSHQPFHKKLHDINQELLSRLEVLVKEIQQLQQWTEKLPIKGKDQDFQYLQRDLQVQCHPLFSKALEAQNWASKESSHLLKEHQGLVLEFEEICSRGCYFKTLYETGLSAAAELELKKLLEFAMEAAIEMTGARRGFLALLNEDEELTFVVARNMEKEKIDHPEFEVSSDIVQEVLRSGQPVKLDDAMGNNHFKCKNSVIKLHLRSVLAVPLKSDDETLGVIYLDNQTRQKCFSEDRLALPHKSPPG